MSPSKGSKVVGVRWGGGQRGPSLPAQLVSLGTSPSFPFFSIWAGGGSGGGSNRRPRKRGSPAPQDSQTLGEGMKGGQWDGGGGGSHRFSSAVAWLCLSFPSPLHVALGGQRQDGGRTEAPGVPAGWENPLPEPAAAAGSAAPGHGRVWA